MAPDRKRRSAGILASIAAGVLSLPLLGAPAHAQPPDPAEILSADIDSYGIALGPNESATVEVNITARHDTGIRHLAWATLEGPDGTNLWDFGSGRCVEVTDTRADCTFEFTPEAGSELSNASAGRWTLDAMVIPGQVGSGYEYWYAAGGHPDSWERNLDSFYIKRDSKIEMDLSPPVTSPGNTVSTIGSLEFADWSSGSGYTGESGHPVKLAFRPYGSSYIQYLDDLTTYSNGVLWGYGVAQEDGYWYFAYQGSDTTEWVYSPVEYVNVVD
ncbi:hypothetical protein [Glycomyces xiaoerkulensis]|uniref:hypothetical protein n=1 Tax=Glycomyces xiaoerkulensis TaxID=2038139 RepID=UPI000C26614C|nr:hypothetical protein [Glycomyces xiaoerkulensis]